MHSAPRRQCRTLLCFNLASSCRVMESDGTGGQSRNFLICMIIHETFGLFRALLDPRGCLGEHFLGPLAPLLALPVWTRILEGKRDQKELFLRLFWAPFLVPKRLKSKTEPRTNFPFGPRAPFGVPGAENIGPGPHKSCFLKTRGAKVRHACFLKEYYMWRAKINYFVMISAQQGLMFEHQDVQKC